MAQIILDHVTEELGSEIMVIFTIDAPYVEHASLAQAAEASQDEDEATAALIGGKSLWTARAITSITQQAG